MPGKLIITYPWEGSLFPPDITPPTFFWEDSTGDVKHWSVIVDSDSLINPLIFDTDENQWSPDSLCWESMKQEGVKRNLSVVVLGHKGRKILSGDQIHIRASRDSVGAPIFYRAVPLPFSYALKHLEEIRWHLGDIASAKSSPALLKNLPFCGNCHSFSRDGSTLAMDVDYANDKGSYVIAGIDQETILTPDKVITWSDYKREDGEKTYGLLSQISSDGRYVASTLKDRSIFVAIDEMYYSQLFFPIKGIVAIYDRETKRYFALPGADDPNYVQSNPTWSPDGQILYFARAPVYMNSEIAASDAVVLPTSMASEFIEGRRGFQYDIYRIPFNNGKGGKPKPVPGASNNGMSNYFPKISPDGKWLVFTKAENFMLLQPDARLYIMPASGDTPREMDCNRDNMNSWHSWSPNGKWLVFSSKFRRAYTDLLLTHIDENGQDSPPVWLERLSFDDRTINIPEFVPTDPANWTSIVDRFSHQSHYYLTIGRHRMGEGKYLEAIRAFDQAVQLDSNFIDGIVFKGHAQFSLGRYRESLQTYRRALALDPNYRDVYVNMGTAAYKLKQYPDALRFYDKAIQEDPENAYPYFARGLVKAKLDDFRGAIRDFDRSTILRPQSQQVYYERGVCKALLKDYREAVRDFTKATGLQPDYFDAFEKLGNCYYHLQSYGDAIRAYDRAIELRPNQSTLLTYRGLCKLELNDLHGALADFDRAILINPNSAIDYYHRGKIKIQLKMKSEGCTDLYRAGELGYRAADKMIRKYCLGK
jgi:tetratricopeptide (TPR) repeat protein